MNEAEIIKGYRYMNKIQMVNDVKNLHTTILQLPIPCVLQWQVLE